MRPSSGGARRGESGELRALVRSGRSASADGPEARESRREYQAGGYVSSIIIKDWLTVRTARKSQNPQPKNEGCGTRDFRWSGAEYGTIDSIRPPSINVLFICGRHYEIARVN